ncbi:MAG: hypothetical protein LBQ59_02895 [Candidatus Peribacteria bacterium]|jgi:hypothetical protein|nr:hypothetical protein [Candidatus Peribacteria bacterium]
MKRKEEEKEIKKFFKKMERKEKKEEEREKTISDAYKIIETLKNNKTHYHMSTVAEILKLKDIFGLRK